MDFTGKIALAPMAGICDLPFRLLCKEMGCDIPTDVYTIPYGVKTLMKYKKEKEAKKNA